MKTGFMKILMVFVSLWMTFSLSSCVSKRVQDARSLLKEECNDPECQPGMGTCYQDPVAEVLVCLCDNGCRVLD